MSSQLYAIVLNWNKYSDTMQCIHALKNSQYPLSKIIIDNGSTDRSVERMQEAFTHDDTIYVIANAENLGFAAGVNIGIKHALNSGADYICLINNDAVVEPGCIYKLLLAMKGAQDVGIAGPRIFYHDSPQRIWQGGGYFSMLKTGIVNPEKNMSEAKAARSIREVTFLTGCMMLIDVRVFERIGFFDEDFFFYSEDADFCLRAKRAGFRLLYVPSAKVWHKIGNIAKERTSAFCMYHLARSRLLFLRKNFSRPYFLYGLLLHLVFYTPYRAWQIIQGSASLDSFKAWVWGTIDGCRSRIDIKKEERLSHG